MMSLQDWWESRLVIAVDDENDSIGFLRLHDDKKSSMRGMQGESERNERELQNHRPQKQLSSSKKKSNLLQLKK